MASRMYRKRIGKANDCVVADVERSKSKQFGGSRSGPFHADRDSRHKKNTNLGNPVPERSTTERPRSKREDAPLRLLYIILFKDGATRDAPPPHHLATWPTLCVVRKPSFLSLLEF